MYEENRKVKNKMKEKCIEITKCIEMKIKFDKIEREYNYMHEKLTKIEIVIKSLKGDVLASESVIFNKRKEIFNLKEKSIGSNINESIKPIDNENYVVNSTNINMCFLQSLE